MGWSRNLGLIRADELQAKLDDATTIERIDYDAKKFVRDAQLTSEGDCKTLQTVSELVAFALKEIGPCHVHLGGGEVVDSMGKRTLNIMLTLSWEG